ncbi:hypothetical protein AB1Y20_016107 [Prymnesium parvum]|uniref:GST C-terminal domain-containing protein n=1 Tax=Prymnesium parvum TaxID=97485 RepID=A0AB34K2Y5_PRYPA
MSAGKWLLPFLCHAAAALVACPSHAHVLHSARVSARAPVVAVEDGKPAPSRGGVRLLEWIPSQQLLVTSARFAWNTLWKVMLSELAPQSDDGDYVRPAPQMGTGATWPAELPVVSGRYHLYLGNACPWCHRVAASARLRQQLLAKTGPPQPTQFLSFTRLVSDPQRASRGGWVFDSDDPDPLCDAADLKGVYDRCTPGGYSGRCTAPLLVDLETSTIISQESADIIRMLGQVSLNPSGRAVDLYPTALRADIDATCKWVYTQVNNGVYGCGFATTQSAYERAERGVHEGLSRCDELLSSQRFLCGAQITEADVWLLPTAVRFDGIYASFFRCGRRQIRSDYPNIARWMKELLQLTGSDLFDLDAARRSYYTDLFPLNPGGIVPSGPSAADLGFPVGDGPVEDATAFSWRSV